ncbi:MAG: acyl carrier protein [Clostridia bacterium]|nr:acyl carrier protein [Clostridia bacterium]
MLKPGVFNKLKPFLADIFDTDESEITPETDLFEDLFADEYDMLELAMIIEEEFGVTPKLPKKGPFTVENLTEAVDKKSKEK